jgi:hypothetical protein
MDSRGMMCMQCTAMGAHMPVVHTYLCALALHMETQLGVEQQQQHRQ